MVTSPDTVYNAASELQAVQVARAPLEASSAQAVQGAAISSHLIHTVTLLGVYNADPASHPVH